MAKCTIMGSANGIENLGDVLLLHCAMRNINAAFPDVDEYVIQVDGDVAVASKLAHQWEPAEYSSNRKYSFEFAASPLQSTCFKSRPRGFGRVPAFIYFPLCLMVCYPAYLLGLWRDKSWLQDWSRSSLVYFYGGSHFSKGFFWANGFPMLLLSLIARAEGVKLVFGPQQFGPQTRVQVVITSFILKLIDHRVFFRNRDCAALYALPTRLTYDEVFISDLYRSALKGNSEPRMGAINFRGSDFESATKEKKELFLQLVSKFHASNCHFWHLFSMSSKKFNDDLVLSEYFGVVESQRNGEIDPDLLSNDLSAASLCLSMSYHGCILAVLQGVETVPIVSGEYYSWKFSDFDRYCGHRNRIRWISNVGWVVGDTDSVNARQRTALIEIRRRASASHISLLRGVVGPISQPTRA